MTEARGRQARLKPGLGRLYPGLEAKVWRTVEDLLRHGAILIDRKLADPRTITGERLLRAGAGYLAAAGVFGIGLRSCQDRSRQL